tara:strand:- start:1284 stop:2390 length:1107 start_codon:yes stop_codon:yes gene_type:complete
MPDVNIGETSQPAATVAPQPSDENKGGNNVGINQAVARMLKVQEEAAKIATPAESVVPEESTTTPSATDAAEVSSAEETAEAPAETPEATPESEDALSHEKPNLDPELKKWVSQKIGERVRSKNTKIAELEARVNQLTLAQQAQSLQKPADNSPAPPLPGSVPLANIEDANGLVALQQQAKEAKRWAQEQLDNEVGQVMLGDKTLAATDLKAIIRNANVTLEDHIPQRAQFLQTRQNQQNRAVQDFPFLNDKSSPDYVLSQQVLMSKPYLKNDPDSAIMVGFMVEGMKAAQQKKVALEKSKAKAPVITKSPPSAQTAVSSNGSAARVPTATKTAQETQGIRQFLSKKGGVTVSEAIAAQTKFEHLRSR